MTARPVTAFPQVSAPLVDMTVAPGAVTGPSKRPPQRSGAGAVRAVSGRVVVPGPTHRFWPVRGTSPPRLRVLRESTRDHGRDDGVAGDRRARLRAADRRRGRPGH